MKNIKEDKTNAMRELDKANILYKATFYEYDENFIDGIDTATKLHLDPDRVFKTLITTDGKKNYYVFCIPVASHLDLKKCAKVAQVKSLEMIHVKDINQVSGYIRGGCSPIGMKKLFPTFIDETCILFDTIYVSGGRLGAQIELSVNDLMKVTKAISADLCTSE